MPKHTTVPVEKLDDTSLVNEDYDVGEVCELTEKDSDAGMRVAENSRIKESNNNSYEDKVHEHQQISKLIDDSKPVKTYEKGEIVVSMDGELLLVQETCVSRQNERRVSSSSTVTLGSIEEPDVLDCWEAETVEPVLSPTKKDEEKQASVEHVQKYYRLHEVEEQENNNEKLDDDDDYEESIEEEPVISCTVPGQDNDEYSKMPIEEAFEVYESCYTAKLPPALDGRFLGRNDRREDGPIPCKAVCCSVQ